MKELVSSAIAFVVMAASFIVLLYLISKYYEIFIPLSIITFAIGLSCGATLNRFLDNLDDYLGERKEQKGC